MELFLFASGCNGCEDKSVEKDFFDFLEGISCFSKNSSSAKEEKKNFAKNFAKFQKTVSLHRFLRKQQQTVRSSRG